MFLKCFFLFCFFLGGGHLLSDMGSTRTTTLTTFVSTTTLSTIMVSQLCRGLSPQNSASFALPLSWLVSCYIWLRRRVFFCCLCLGRKIGKIGKIPLGTVSVPDFLPQSTWYFCTSPWSSGFCKFGRWLFKNFCGRGRGELLSSMVVMCLLPVSPKARKKSL